MAVTYDIVLASPFHNYDFFAHRMRELCGQLGLTFFPKGDETLLGRLAQFHLFSQGHSKKIKNMLHGETPDAEIAVFGYRYTTGGGKNSQTLSQTVMYFRSPSLRLPQFALRPERLFHRIGCPSSRR